MSSKTNIQNIISKCIKDLRNDLCLENDIDAIAVIIVENMVNNNIEINDLVERVNREIEDNLDLY